MRLPILAALLAAALPSLHADEGMWTFDNLPLKQLKEKYGFEPSKAWIDQVATWPGNRGHGVIVKGETARAIAVCKLAVALFCHFRWFWGIVSTYRVFTIGMVVSLILFLGGLVTALYFAFR